MLINENKHLEYFAGIFCFNPLDDPHHLERIEKNITSICIAAVRSGLKIKIVVGMNRSEVLIGDRKINGIGEQTETLIQNLNKKYSFDILDYVGTNANSRGYSKLMEYGFTNTDAKKIVIFADDYIMPYFWFDLMEKNFDAMPNAAFMTPATCYVAQDNLRYEIQNYPEWDIRVAEKGDHKKWNFQTIYGGVEIEHINEIAKTFVSNGIIPYCDPPSFETTVFKRSLIKEVGFIHEEYYSCFYDNDYFNMIKDKSFVGYIAKNCFIFHYGKGGTKALYKETADEKFKESPVHHQLISDLEIWNKRWKQNIKPWWGSKET
jgi:hypothetical protein